MLICSDVLKGLPGWFGIPEAIDEYIEKSADMPFYVSYDNNTITGFIAIKPHNKYSAEIYVMGIDRNYHRKGIGKKLIDKSLEWCKENDIEFLQVKTLDALNPNVNYEKTRKFYETIGFRPLECFETLWDVKNPCLQMIIKIK